MPREIKFRIWNRRTNCMYADTGLTSSGLNDAVNKAYESDYIIMQYTGLKDKNGVEIWEGDVVRIPTGYKFLVSMAHFSLGYEGSGAYGYAYYKHGEVLGNLYENPELLGDKDAN